jgi:dihydroxyacetone kinase-like protein
MLSGFKSVNRDIVSMIPNSNVITRIDSPIKGKVALIAGGGSGHEPAHAGYVGRGMLDAVLVGSIFCAPALSDALKAIEKCNGGEGILFIIKNYTGDILLFDMASEEAKKLGIKTRSVVVSDDIALKVDTKKDNNRRGVAGTVFVHKIAGAMAEKGGNLEKVFEVAQKAANMTRTLGVALYPCVVPGREKASFELEEDEIEIGIGIHGEAGVSREKIKPAKIVVAEMMEKIVADLPLVSGDDVAVMINGMGATPLMELYIVFNEVEQYLNGRKLGVYRSYVGEYMTSLEMAGFSITLLKLDDELKGLLDYPCETSTFIQNNRGERK